MSERARIGLYPGTFDPVTNGALVVERPDERRSRVEVLGQFREPHMVGMKTGDDLVANLPNRGSVVAEEPRLDLFVARGPILLTRAHQHDVAAGAHAADEPPNRDAPHPGADLAPPLVAPSALPHGDEGVLQHVGDDFAVVAPAAQPHRQPRGVPVVELPQGAEVPIGQGLEEGLVVAGDERAAKITTARDLAVAALPTESDE